MTVAILAAGRASRLGGQSKLLVEADGLPVVEWHRRALNGRRGVAVVRQRDAEQLRREAPWLDLVVHRDFDGPGGALRAFLDAEPSVNRVTVLFGDTLLPLIPEVDGDWVGVAPAPWRVWDYRNMAGQWVRGVPRVLVCCGVYQFTDRGLLYDTLDVLLDSVSGELPMASVISHYGSKRPLRELHVDGWQDAGDPEALARVRNPSVYAPSWETEGITRP